MEPYRAITLRKLVYCSLSREAAKIQFFRDDAPNPNPNPTCSQILQCAGSVSAASIESQDQDCTPLLCKLKPAITAACAAYSPGASLGGNSLTVTADNTSTNVAVAWNRDSKVATLAWRGTQETEVGLPTLSICQ